jgi:hypothetical protein
MKSSPSRNDAPPFRPEPPASDDFTTSGKAMLFWIAVPIALVVAFAVFSELTGAK